MTSSYLDGLVQAYHDVQFYAQSMIPKENALDSPWLDMALYAQTGAMEAKEGIIPVHVRTN